MDNPNPIYYKDLIQPDDSIQNLINQLSELIGQYEKLRSEVQSAAADAAKAMQGLSGATDEQRQAIAQSAQKAEEMASKYRRLTDEEVQLKAAQQEIIAANRESVKMARLQKEAADAAEGSYKRLSAQYRINKEQLNKMSKADREGSDAGKKLEEQTRKIYEEMSRLQKATGKYTLEVGHYENALKGLPGILGQFGNSLASARQQATTMKESVSTLAGGLGMSSGGLLATIGLVAAGVGAAVGAFKLWKNSINETQTTGDAMALEVAKWNGAWEVFQKSISTFDFTGFIHGALEAARAAGQLRATMDEMFERENSIRLQRAAVAAENEIYLEQLRNQKLTNTERIEAGRAYLAAMEPLYEQEKKLAKDVADAQLEYLFSVTNRTKFASEEQREAAKQEFASFIERYNVNREGIKQAQELIRAEDSLATARQQQMLSTSSLQFSLAGQISASSKAIVDGATDETRALANLLRQYNLTKDEEVANYVEAQEKYLNANKAMLADNRRIYTQINSLEAQLLKDETKATEERRILAERDAVTRAEASESVSADIRVRAAMLDNELQNERDTAEGIRGAMDKLLSETRALGIKRVSTVEEYYKQVRAAYTNNEKSVAENIIRQMIAAATEQAAILSTAAESGTEEVWQAIGAKSAEEAKQMAQQAKTDAENIVIAANKAMKETGAGLSWRFYSPAQGWSAIAPESGTTDTGGSADAGGGTTDKKPTKSGGGWSLQSDKTYLKERAKIVREYYSGEIASREEYDRTLSEMEISTLEKRLGKLRENSSEYLKIETQLNEKRIALREKDEAAAKAAAEASEKELDDARKAQQKHTLDTLKVQEQEIKMRIDAGEDLKIKLLEKQREIALESNRQLAADLQVSDALINAKFDKLIRDAQQKAQEGAEKAGKAIDGKKAPKMANDLFDVFGIHLGDEGEGEEILDQRKEMLKQAIDSVRESVSSLVDSWREQAHAAVEAADSQVDAAQKIVDAEKEAAAQGYAANVERAEAELALAKKNQKEAIAEERKAQKAQMAIDTMTQASSLVTASANIWKSLSGIPMVGPALAVAALALMWGSFAASKIKAAQLSKESYGDGTVELLKGGSHASGHDIYLGMTEDGKERHAEGGEYFAVINKRNSRKYGSIIPDVINSFNDGTFAEKYMRSGEAMKGYAVQLMGGTDLSRVEAGIDAIRRQGEESRTTEGGYTVIRYKNLTRRVKS